MTQVEGLQSCEFLNKLDLTVNFVDIDELESSVTAMEGNQHLGDLYMMGNPCQVHAQPRVPHLVASTRPSPISEFNPQTVVIACSEFLWLT